MPVRAPGSPSLDSGQAEAEDDMLIPHRPRLAIDDAGKGQPIGVVDDQGDVGLYRQPVEVGDLLVGQDVAGGVGRPGDADRADLVGDAQGIEVYPVFEEAVVQVLDLRPVGDEQVIDDAGVGVANVLRGQRQQDFLARAAGIFAGKHIE